MSATWSDPPTLEVPPMPPASDERLSLEDLLRMLLEGDRGDRARALLAAINQQSDGVTLADYCCGALDDPLVLTFRQLYRHLCTEDHPAKVTARGFRSHNTINVLPWHEDLGGHGPAFKRGPS